MFLLVTPSSFCLDIDFFVFHHRQGLHLRKWWDLSMKLLPYSLGKQDFSFITAMLSLCNDNMFLRTLNSNWLPCFTLEAVLDPSAAIKVPSDGH